MENEHQVQQESIKEELISGATLLFFAILIFWVGGVLASGVLLGLISSVGFAILMFESRKAIPKVYRLMVKNPFWTDLVTTVLVLGVFGTSVNGLIASAVFGVLNTVILMLLNKYDPQDELESKPLKQTISDLFWGKKNRKVVSEPIDIECDVAA